MGQFGLNGRTSYETAGAPRPHVAQRQFVENGSCLGARAGEGARGPSRSGSQRPNLEFQTDPPPGGG